MAVSRGAKRHPHLEACGQRLKKDTHFCSELSLPLTACSMDVEANRRAREGAGVS
jgi:predicted nucleic acid-binding Zn ribbon protein